MLTLFIVNGMIVTGLVWIIGVLIKDAFTNRRKDVHQAIRESHMPRWARTRS